MVDEPCPFDIVQAVFDIVAGERLEVLDFLFGQWPLEQVAERIHAARRVRSEQRLGEHERIDKLVRMEMRVEPADRTIIVFPRPYFLELDDWPARLPLILAALKDASPHGEGKSAMEKIAFRHAGVEYR